MSNRVSKAASLSRNSPMQKRVRNIGFSVRINLTRIFDKSFTPTSLDGLMTRFRKLSACDTFESILADRKLTHVEPLFVNQPRLCL
jgi:hypothetical protein